MLTGLPPDLKEALALGVSCMLGKARGATPTAAGSIRPMTISRTRPEMAPGPCYCCRATSCSERFYDSNAGPRDRKSELYGSRAEGWIRLTACQPNGVQATIQQMKWGILLGTGKLRSEVSSQRLFETFAARSSFFEADGPFR